MQKLTFQNDNKDATVMQELAQQIDACINTPGSLRQAGFVLVVFPFGQASGAISHYVSSAADRQAIASVLRQVAQRINPTN